MRIQHMIFALFGALSLAGAVQAEDYPAANFQPKVIFASPEATAAAAPATSSASANPCVAAPVSVAQSEFDARYPAASFQPKVIYNSADAR